ncbi:GPW/gp25 family protein [Pseudomonas sp. 5P_3.1_Bac2]|uniref:GPW/gp25 family protein n=1 Tax=Pseudomonas sp. 5P_3.1_Bac2 TaxID=2971617 RepID=UPI0021CAA1F9|nr:GPW/gp25 family protein [Pseudomonas sp. 5P_3.1_Bac2]MCU1718676.1 GPW/gp25 family protein [Pseudomonas sp. 5P_3.1_Bac2]
MSTPIDYSSISATHWQPALGAAGEVVEGLRDIDQAIRIILTTPRGSDPHRPEFGSELQRYLDWPTHRVVPHLVREAVEAIRRWEPRVTLVQVLTTIESSHIVLRVQWKVADGVLQQTEVPYARSSSA